MEKLNCDLFSACSTKASYKEDQNPGKPDEIDNALDVSSYFEVPWVQYSEKGAMPLLRRNLIPLGIGMVLLSGFAQR